jgi:hypothetical protein
VQPIDHSELEGNGYYWAVRIGPDIEGAALEPVQVSTVFGSTPEYLSVAVLGTDQHYSLNNFTFLAKIAPHPDLVGSLALAEGTEA